jgi:hypothetical protein
MFAEWKPFISNLPKVKVPSLLQDRDSGTPFSDGLRKASPHKNQFFTAFWGGGRATKLPIGIGLTLESRTQVQLGLRTPSILTFITK